MESKKGLSRSSHLVKSDSFSAVLNSSLKLCSASRTPAPAVAGLLGRPFLHSSSGSLGLDGSWPVDGKTSSSGVPFLPGDPLSIFSFSGAPDSVL